MSRIENIEVCFDGGEDDLATVCIDEGDVRRFEQIKLFPLIHFGDPPPSGEDAGEGGRMLRHVAAPIRSRR